MEIHILVRRLIYIETASRLQTKRNAIINSVYPKPISKWINALRPDYTKSKHKSMMIQHKIGEKSTNASNCGGINMINMYIGSTSLNASGWATSVLNDGKSQIIERNSSRVWPIDHMKTNIVCCMWKENNDFCTFTLHWALATSTNAMVKN